MKSNQKIYIVIPNGADTVDDIEAVFDSREKAAQFNARFKTDSAHEIVDYPLNPRYKTDKTIDPYLVKLEKTGNKPVVMWLNHNVRRLKEAKFEVFSIADYELANARDPLFSVMLFAASREEAVVKAIAIRDEVIAQGKWQLCYADSLKGMPAENDGWEKDEALSHKRYDFQSDLKWALLILGIAALVFLFKQLLIHLLSGS